MASPTITLWPGNRYFNLIFCDDITRHFHFKNDTPKNSHKVLTIDVCFYFIFIYLEGRVMEVGRKRVSQSICGFYLQMPTSASDRPGPTRESEILCGAPTQLTEAQALEPLPAASKDAAVGSYLESRQAGNGRTCMRKGMGLNQLYHDSQN